jgi:hypothetical protein
MQTLKDRKPLLEKMLAILVLISICCNFPSLLSWSLCLKQDLLRRPNTEILISACNQRLKVIGMPDGEALFVGKFHPGTAHLYDDAYLLDLRTGKKRSVPNHRPLMETRGVFLSSELVWFRGDIWGTVSNVEAKDYRPNYILDLTDGQRYELISLNQIPLLPGDQFDPKYHAYFQFAESVFILQESNIAIGLSANFRQNPQGNVFYYLRQPNTGIEFEDGEALEQLMKDLGVKYKLVDLSYRYFLSADIPSPTGRYVLRDDGIHLLEMDKPVIRLHSRYAFVGWYYDESAVIIRESGYHLIDLGSAFGSSWEFFYIPGPVLKVPLPDGE